RNVTGVQTCALPISRAARAAGTEAGEGPAGSLRAPVASVRAEHCAQLVLQRLQARIGAAADLSDLRAGRAAGELRDDLEVALELRLGAGRAHHHPRSEEHTSELQSRFDLVCRLLLVKKN